jgi:acyl carrier protein/surfactin synthase thioesterase subunit
MMKAIATAPITSSCWAAAVKIIEEESGIDAKELTNDTAWSDIGVDSLLSLVISSRFKEELSVDIDSSDFLIMPTVGEVKAFLARNDTTVSQPPGIAAAPTRETITVTVPQPIVTQQPLPSSSSTDFDALMTIISQESGVAPEDLTDDSNFADIGIDSLLTLVITSRCSEELGLDLDGQSRIFLEYPTVGELRRYFLASDEVTTPVQVSAERSNGTSTPESTGPSPFTPPEEPVIATPMSELAEQPITLVASPKPGSVRSTSVVLQGKTATATRTLFFFPDGSGSAYSYAQLPRIAPDVAVIGLNCPFLREPARLRALDFDDVMDLYLGEVRARQAHGPYFLGGWSSGGIFAFRAAQRLTDEGETVACLVLIDAPVPRGMDRLPHRFYEHLKRYDVFGQQAPQSFQRENKGSASGGPPEWLVPHFNATIDLLETYYADPLPEGRVPKTSIVWAGESVLDGVNIPKLEPGPDDTEGMKFLSEKRTDFSAGGWADLIPGVEVRVETLSEAHHFSMMVSVLPSGLPEMGAGY